MNTCTCLTPKFHRCSPSVGDQDRFHFDRSEVSVNKLTCVFKQLKLQIKRAEYLLSYKLSKYLRIEICYTQINIYLSQVALRPEFELCFPLPSFLPPLRSILCSRLPRSKEQGDCILLYIVFSPAS